MVAQQDESRTHRNALADRAYDVQFRGGVKGAIMWTIYGAIACTVGHYTWPLFRRQTLALKGFLTSSATVAGLVIGADSHLLEHESAVRRLENEQRRKARNALAMQGRIATEGEIRKWVNEKKAADALAVEGKKEGSI